MRKSALLVSFAVAVGLAGAVLAQQMQGMEHGHDGGDDDVLTWRMPPMDPDMPMLPGLMGALPRVGPLLPGFGIDPMDYPPARPRQILDLADGDEITLTASVVRRMIAGKHYIMFAYNGQYPGPLLRAPTGATVVVNFVNQIDMPTTVHWHGLRLDNRFDGVPDVTQAPVLPGGTFRYEVRFSDTGVYWYHPHMREDVQQDLGLYGNLLAVPPEPDYYAEVNREEFLILDDILIGEQGIVPYGDGAPTHSLMGRFGNVMLINGATDYRLSVQRGEVVRFYVTNVANARTFNLTFGGARIKVVASDLSKYEHEVWVASVPIAPAERYVVEVQFDEAGTVPIENSIQAIDHFRGEFYAHVDLLGQVEVAEETVGNDLSVAFGELRENRDVSEDIASYRQYFDRSPDYELELTLEVGALPLAIIQSMEFEKGLYVPPVEWNDTMPMMNWLSTGEDVRWILRDRATGRENMDIHWSFKRGDVIKLRVFNNPDSLHPMHHPIHVHGQRYLVIAIDGVPNPNLVWKDTAIVPVASTVDLLIEMTNPGSWMLHCHIAEHLHSGMMLSFSVE